MIQEQFIVYCATLSMAYILAMSPITKMYSCISLLILPNKMKLRRSLSIDAQGKNILLKKLQRNLSIMSETLLMLKLLRKFLSKKKINMASLFETYDFMDAPLTIEDLRECNTPKFLARFPSTDLLRINLNNVITEFEATSLKFLSEENSVPLSAERVS